MVFFPHLSVYLGTELGTVLTIASANDVDTYPTLAYSFDEVHTDEEALALFAIDRFSGKVLLKKPLDYEMRQEYQLKIFASDTKYTAQSTLTIHIADENDNAPIFSQLMYQTTISGGFLPFLLTFFLEFLSLTVFSSHFELTNWNQSKF